MKNSTLRFMSMACVALALLFSTSAQAQLANDDCSGAEMLTFAADSASCSGTSGTTIGATQSADPADVCSASWFDDDVWYMFTTPASIGNGIVVSLSFDQAGDPNDFGNSGMALYSGCGNGELAIQCYSGGTNYIKSDALSPSTTYYIRVWSSNDTNPQGGNFRICVYGASPCNMGVLGTTGPINQCAGFPEVIVTHSSNVPNLGGVAFQFTEGAGAGGGLAGGFTLTGAPEIYSFDEDLNGVLSANNLQPLTGQWFITPTLYADGNFATTTFCDSLGSVEVNFLPLSDPACINAGVNELSLDENLSIYPNPASDMLTISSELDGFNNIRIVTLDGREIQNLGAVDFDMSDIHNVSLEGMSDGAYFLHVVRNGQSTMKRFVVAH